MEPDVHPPRVAKGPGTPRKLVLPEGTCEAYWQYAQRPSLTLTRAITTVSTAPATLKAPETGKHLSALSGHGENM